MDSKEREQNRGIFALGLLAVLISLKLQNEVIEFRGIDITFFIDLNIFLWIIYGFSMIISFSDDFFFSKTARDFFIQLELYLYMQVMFYLLFYQLYCHL